MVKYKINLYKTFKKVKELLVKNKIKAFDAAEIFGVSIKQYYRIIKGEVTPRLSVFINICNYFSVSMEEIIYVDIAK